MFGPGAKNMKSKNIILIPIKDAKSELNRARILFPQADFVTIDAIEHDTINNPVANILEQLSYHTYISDTGFYFLTGRNEAQREITQNQIQHCGFSEDNFAPMSKHVTFSVWLCCN